MAEKAPNHVARPLLGIGVVAAALAIAGAVTLSNGGPPAAGECPANPQAAAVIDAAAQGELAALQPTATGRSYANLAIADKDGQALKLGDVAGKPLLVNFWATWCAPCRKEMPGLDTLATRFAPDNFAVVPVNLDIGAEGARKAADFLVAENLPNLPLYADPSFAAFDRLKREGVAIGLPATLLLDQAGCEIAVLQGPAEWNSPDGIRVVEALIGLEDSAD